MNYELSIIMSKNNFFYAPKGTLGCIIIVIAMSICVYCVFVHPFEMCPSHNFVITYPIQFKLHIIIEHSVNVCRAQISDLYLKGQVCPYKLCLSHNFLVYHLIPFKFYTIIEHNGKVCCTQISDRHLKGQGHTWRSTDCFSNVVPNDVSQP